MSPERRKRKTQWQVDCAKKACRDPALWPKHIRKQVRARARVYGLPFNLEVCDIVLGPCCPVFGTPWALGHVAHPYSPTVDRVVPALGYVKGNVQVISRRANQIKSDASAAEVHRVAQWMDTLTPAAE